MQFSLLLALLCTLIAAELSPSTPVQRPLVEGFVVLLVASAAPVYAMLITRWGILERFGLRRLRAFFEVVWMASVAGITLGTSWCQVVRGNWQLENAVLVDEVLILAPVFVPLLLAWSLLQEAGFRPTTNPAGLGVASSLYRKLREMWQLTRNHLLVLLSPVLVLIAVRDLIQWIAPSWQAHASDCWLYAPVLIAMFCGLPLLLRHVWQTEPLPPGPLRDRLERAAHRVGIEVRHIRIWHTGGAIANAAVTGMTSAARHVFLTDRLVRHLSHAEIEAVFLHELGHVRHRHLPLRAAATGLPVCAWAVLFPQPETSTNVLVGVGVSLVVAAYGWWVFGAFSQRLERQADLFACRQLAAAPGQAARSDLSAAVAVYTSALEKLAELNGIDRRKNTWQHGRIADRVAWMREMQHRPLAVRRFQLRLRIAGSVMFGLIIALAVHLSGVAWAS